MCNTGRVIEFRLDGLRLKRWLVTWSAIDCDIDLELSINSPVGRVLLLAEVGDELTVAAPGGELALKVLKVGDRDNGRVPVVREGSGPDPVGGEALVGAAGPGE